LSGRPTLENLIEVQVKFGLPAAALVEKDWFVIQALHAIVAADKGPFQLVFQGGTALSRAWGLIHRMSEDIDIKIVSKGPPPRSALRRPRESITGELLKAGFAFDPDNPDNRKSNYESRYTLYRLPFAPIAEGKGALRPQIQIETSAWPVRRPSVERPVASFIAEAFGRAPEIAAIPCAAIVETAAEKFIALTRRAGAELAGPRRDRDPTLVRHLYDLHVISGHYDLAEVAALAREIMIADAETYGHQFPAYLKDPLRETLRAVDGIADDPGFSRNYAAFVTEMVFGAKPEFEAAIATPRGLADAIA
jgi:predicted nucleotidyltransferase component of viral defense system